MRYEILPLMYTYYGNFTPCEYCPELYKILLLTAVCILTSVNISISRRSSWSGQQTWPRPCTACPGTPTNCPSPRPAPPRWPTAPLCLVLTPRIPDNWRSASRTQVVSGRKVGQVKVKTNQTKIITSASKWPPLPEKKINLRNSAKCLTLSPRKTASSKTSRNFQTRCLPVS